MPKTYVMEGGAKTRAHLSYGKCIDDGRTWLGTGI